METIQQLLDLVNLPMLATAFAVVMGFLNRDKLGPLLSRILKPTPVTPEPAQEPNQQTLIEQALQLLLNQLSTRCDCDEKFIEGVTATRRIRQLLAAPEARNGTFDPEK